MSYRLKLILLGSLALGVSACADAGDEERNDLGRITIAAGLGHPWVMAFLRDGRVPVTERPRRLRLIERDGKPGPPIEGVPVVNVDDVVADPHRQAGAGVTAHWKKRAE